ncbi:hypothetical protein L1049_007178 [Liquidambar formosana]|uniref:F-box associated beta-propeller type 3 domain-containing protein n=1 Tax=Liquidambar formosana TaxID=63359 RepID=A0AAP0RGW0_LIQFO
MIATNGTIYWRISFGSSAITREEELIVSFDTEHEKFRTLSYPANLPYINKKKTRIMELGGRLCLVDIKSASVSSTMVIWTLKDYDNCIWVKGYSIDMAANWDIRFVLIAKDYEQWRNNFGPN